MANVIVINPFEVPKGKEGQALVMWEKYAEYFRRQPGYVSTKLHRSVNLDARFYLVNVAEWTTADSFLAALKNPELRTIAEGSAEDFPHYPGLYEVIRT